MKKFFQFIGFIVFVVFLFSLFAMGSSILSFLHLGKEKIEKNAVLILDLKGIIIDGQKFLDDLREYSEREEIKGLLVRIDSPGGVVGPSQEIYSELKTIRETLKKPIVVHSSGLLASGAYYSAVGADKIVVNPGTLMGSIGVIMEFVNLQGVYSWAKINRYVLKTGKFKDTGADYRPMTDEERKYIQSVMDEVWEQFKSAVAQGRNLAPEIVNQYADGRIFTGETGVKLGFADQVGTETDALKLLGSLAGLGDKPETFEVPKKRPSIFELLMSDEFTEEARNTLKNQMQRLSLSGKLLFIMPGSWMN